MKKIITAMIFISAFSFAKSQDRKGFEDHTGNPIVLAPGSEGEWDAGAIGSVTVIKVKNKFHMYYEAWGRMGQKATRQDYESLQIGHATSADGILWEKDPANPVIKKGKKGEWDEDGTWDAFVI